MAPAPSEITLELSPTRRFELIDVAEKVREREAGFFSRYSKSALCSFHTTAGYLEERLCARFDHSGQRLGRFVGLFRRLFPPEAGYYHDRMELREELTESEKADEPVNADSHLTFMGAGLNNLVTYRPEDDDPIYFIDLDGVNGELARTRRTTVLGYDRERQVHRGTFALPVAGEHPLDSFDLRQPEYGLFEYLDEVLDRHGVERGRVDIRLAPGERHAGLTVNEYETLLMRNDLPAAIRNPLRYVVSHGRDLLRNPGAIPGKTRDYAVYDLVHLYNEIMDALGVGRAVADGILSRLSGPAFRLFRLKRGVGFLVSDSPATGPRRIVRGRYQSPILIQHQPATGGRRHLEVGVWRFE